MPRGDTRVQKFGWNRSSSSEARPAHAAEPIPRAPDTSGVGAGGVAGSGRARGAPRRGRAQPAFSTTCHGSEPGDRTRDATDRTQCGCRPHGQSRARPYNTVHPKVGLGYLPPALETVDPPGRPPGSALPGASDGGKPAMHKHLNRTGHGGQVRPCRSAGAAETAGGRVGRPFGNGVLHLAAPDPMVEDQERIVGAIPRSRRKV